MLLLLSAMMVLLLTGDTAAADDADGCGASVSDDNRDVESDG